MKLLTDAARAPKRTPRSLVAMLAMTTMAIGTLCSATAASAKPARAALTDGPTSVVAYGALADGTGDSTAAFLRAEDAALASTYRFAGGPSGAPQAVVSVPPGTYRLLRLTFRSNIRMEVDAAAVLEQAGGRNVNLSGGPAALIIWDGPQAAPLSNVTLIGVGSSTAGLKSLATPVFAGWSLSSDFTFDLDPATTDANDLVSGLEALNVSGFLIENVFSIENNSQPLTRPATEAGWWPQSRKSVLGLREQPTTPANGTMYYDPHNGTVSNWYNIFGPKGFGPNQVNAGHDLTFQHLFSQGGTTLRLETDGSQGKPFAAELRGVTADDIAGLNCNRAVSFAPHAQFNYDVNVTHVQAVSCSSGVIESFDESNKFPPGAFLASSIADVTVTAGVNAQLGVTGTDGIWQVGRSDRAFDKDKATMRLWSVMYAAGTYGCVGAYHATPDRIMTTAGLLRPICS